MVHFLGSKGTLVTKWVFLADDFKGNIVGYINQCFSCTFH